MKVSQTLRAARELIVRDGWCQGISRGSQRCADYAIRDAVRGHRSGFEVPDFQQRFTDSIGYLSVAATGKTSLSTITWNDAEGRTVEEVLAAFDGAICLAKRDEAKVEATFACRAVLSNRLK